MDATVRKYEINLEEAMKYDPLVGKMDEEDGN